MQVAYYQASIPAFVLADEAATLGKLTRAHGFALEHQQRNAWLREISLMKRALQHFKTGNIFFEFAIPRMGKRADVIWFASLLSGRSMAGPAREANGALSGAPTGQQKRRKSRPATSVKTSYR